MIESSTGLPILFASLMGLSMLIYGLLDGYDLGVGILSGFTKTREEKNKMIASIGPFWDANETWLVLGVGILLIAFPKAHPPWAPGRRPGRRVLTRALTTASFVSQWQRPAPTRSKFWNFFGMAAPIAKPLKAHWPPGRLAWPRMWFFVRFMCPFERRLTSAFFTALSRWALRTS